MKVFIHFKPRKAYDAFEGTRLRKTLKGACEVVDIPWVDSPQEDVALAHFLSPMDWSLMRSQQEKGVKAVVSAFYAEDDPNASFLVSDKALLKLSKTGKRMLDQADLVLVPDERMKAFAIDAGVQGPIEVLEPAVRMNRFSKNAAEKRIFRRYFGVPAEAKVGFL